MAKLLKVLMLGCLLLAGCNASGDIGVITAIPDLPTATATPLLNGDAEAVVTGEMKVTIVGTPLNPPAPSMTPTVTPTVDEPTATPVEHVETSTTTSTQNTFALVTSTPSENNLAPGVARAIAMATDTYLEPKFAEDSPRIVFDEYPVPIQFSEFYRGFSIREGLLFTEKLKSLDGQKVVMEGYVAPPLKPRLDFFVLTRVQLAFCPFCSSDVEWPDDIALVYLPEQEVLSTEFPIRLVGQLELGTSVDAETGMVSLVRIYAEEITPIIR